jgi:GNAT superfamily N-acetyltransferase
MRGIMTTKPELEKPMIRVNYDSEDEKGPALVAASLGAEIAARFGPRNESPLSILAYDDDSLVGGLNGCIHWRWFYIRQFWVEASWRGRGVGGRLLVRAEAEARAQNCVGLYLDTFDPASVKFYQQRGFMLFGRIDGFPPGSARSFLHKKLAAG